MIEVNGPGDVCDETTRLFAPTLVLNARDDVALMQEEISGPVLPLVEYGDDTLRMALSFLLRRA